MMKRQGSKVKSGEAAHEETGPSWANGIRCILDLALSPPEFLRPIEPPVHLYLEEVTLGMIGGAGDPAAQSQAQSIPEVPSHNRKMGTKPTSADCMQALLRVISGTPAADTCTLLFWLVLGAIFGTLPTQAHSALRSELGESWYVFTLQVRDAIPGDREVQDWITAAIPFVFAQAIYRLLTDGFVEDRKHLVKEADVLINKTSLIVHFELTGFQLNSETIRRARKRLFLRRVVQGPHVDQREFMKGKKRQEILESHSAGAGEQPLEFGKMDGRPLEETQLEHVMHGSDRQRQEDEKALALGKIVYELKNLPVPADLSVVRYSHLGERAETMFERHIAELDRCSGKDRPSWGDGLEEAEPTPSSSRAPSEPMSPMSSPVSPMSRTKSFGATWPRATMAPTGAGEDAEGGVDDTPRAQEKDGTPTAKMKTQRLWRKGILIAKFNVAKDDHRARKERESKARKLRQETLHKKICVDPLPKELSEKTLETTWVSPAMMSLQHEHDRHGLNKRSAEAFHLKMAVRPTPARRLSMPALRSATKVDTPPRRRAPAEGSVAGGSQMSPERGGGVQAREESSASTVVNGASSVRGSGVLAPRGEAVCSSPSLLSRAGAVGMLATLQKPAVERARGEVINLDPPQRLSTRLALQRLEAQEKAFQKQSFAIYMKEHDVLTGIKKTRFDEKRLMDEEDAYVKKMSLLVGGPPRKQIPPESMLTRLNLGRSRGGTVAKDVGVAGHVVVAAK